MIYNITFICRLLERDTSLNLPILINQFQEQKRLVGSLEQAVADSKMMYSEALRNLERISDEIHQQRKDAQLRKEMGTRGSGVGAEEPHPPPVDGERPPKKEIHAGHVTVNRTNSQTQTESDMLEEGSDRLEKPSNGDVHQEDSAEVIGKREGVSETEQSQVNHTSISQKETQCTESKEQIVKRAPVGAVPGVPQSLLKSRYLSMTETDSTWRWKIQKQCQRPCQVRRCWLRAQARLPYIRQLWPPQRRNMNQRRMSKAPKLTWDHGDAAKG